MQIMKGKEQAYAAWKTENSDPYGSLIFTYAERWAGMLEAAIEKSTDEPMKVIVDNADRLSHEADTEIISGFAFGCAVSALSQYWSYGNELQEWYKKKYN